MKTKYKRLFVGYGIVVIATMIAWVLIREEFVFHPYYWFEQFDPILGLPGIVEVGLFWSAVASIVFGCWRTE